VLNKSFQCSVMLLNAVTYLRHFLILFFPKLSNFLHDHWLISIVNLQYIHAFASLVPELSVNFYSLLNPGARGEIQ